MKIRDVVINNFNDLPGYKLKGYSEVAVPLFQRRAEALVLTKRALPVVEEFVLNFYNEKLSLEEITSILGIENELVEEAFVSLIQRDYINLHDKMITDNGTRYLQENSLEVLDKNEIIIIIDGLTGEVRKKNNNLMVSRRIKENGIKSLRSNIEMPSINNIEFKDIKRIFNIYKKEEDEVYSGDILDIINIKGNTTKYKRIDILIFENEEYDVRVIAFDGYNRVEEYEESLINLDSKGLNLLSYKFKGYFNEYSIKNIDNILIDSSNKKSINRVEYRDINNLYNQYLVDQENDILITIPLISKCTFKDGFIEDIEKKINEGVNLKIVLCGNDYIDEHQKKSIEKLEKLCKKHENLNVIQSPRYINYMILNKKNNEALISKYEEHKISLNTTTIGIIERFYEVKGDAFKDVHLTLQNTIKDRDLVEIKPYFYNEQDLKNSIIRIADLVRDADGYMNSNDGVGWIGRNDIPEVQAFLDVHLANDGNKFRTFIDIINKSLVESLDINSKSKRKVKYFWNDFKNTYPKLQKSLDRIRTYRNKGNHLQLDENNQKKYLSYLKQDLNGYMPEFIENGYLILQYIIIKELERAIEHTISGIK